MHIGESVSYRNIVLYGLLCRMSGSILKRNHFARLTPLTLLYLVLFLCFDFVINSPTLMSNEESVFLQTCKATVLLICLNNDTRKGLKKMTECRMRLCLGLQCM